MQGKLLTLICALALARGVLSNVDPFFSCSRACNACICLPIEPPTVCSPKEAEGILLPHEHCNKFYICNHGSKVTFDCPSDLLFNPLTEQCDYAHNVVCGDRVIPEKEEKEEVEVDNSIGDSEEVEVENGNGDNDSNIEGGSCNCNPDDAPVICSVSGSEGTLVAHDVCNKFFICNHGLPVAMKCPGKLLYNPHKERCDWPHKVECGDRVIVAEPEDNNNNSESDNENSEEVEVENGNGDNDSNIEGGSCNCNPDDAPVICSVSESEGTLVAHDVCNKFFICNHGLPVAMKCPGKLLYNPHKERCDWPHKVECGDRVIVAEPEDNNNNSESDSENNSGDNENSGENIACNCNPGEAPSICAVEESDGILVAHEVCNKYYICDHGVATALKCPKDLLYNPYTERCDWPYKVKCGDRVIVAETEEEEEEHSSEDSENGDNSNENCGDNDNNVGSCNCNPSEAPSICSNEGSDGTLVAHEVCCNFYVCDNGVPVTKHCPFGLLYNPHTEKCDWPHNVECGDRVVTEESENENSGHESEEDDSNNEPEPEIDLFEIAKAQCAEDESDGHMAVHQNCHQFYVCLKHEPAVLSCPLGLYFDAEKHTCEWPQNVQCGSRILTEN